MSPKKLIKFIFTKTVVQNDKLIDQFVESLPFRSEGEAMSYAKKMGYNVVHHGTMIYRSTLKFFVVKPNGAESPHNLSWDEAMDEARMWAGTDIYRAAGVHEYRSTADDVINFVAKNHTKNHALPRLAVYGEEIYGNMH